MKVNRWVGLLITIVVLGSTLLPAGVFAEGKRTIDDETIYDLLVDRYNNGSGENDIGVDSRDLTAFNGGDFNGIVDRLTHITDMGFTMVSLGPVFESESYDGKKVLNYAKLEPHFGTDEEFVNMLDALHAKDLAVIADFPLGGVSEHHVWVQEGLLKFTPDTDGTIDWDASDVATQQALRDAVVKFMETYSLDGIRLTEIGAYDIAFLNDLIEAVKTVNPDAYVITNEMSGANFDASPDFDKMNALRSSFVRFDADTSSLSLFTNDSRGQLIQFDELTGPRYTYDIVEERMFPPTRWKLAAAALFSLPGTPIMTYGTEIAVNGEAPPESHQLLNFKTDAELKDYISDLNTLRNQSETFRNGDFEMLHNENGFTVFKLSSDEETWIVALNNTTKTASLEIPKEVIGENKLLRGVLDGDLAREGKDGVFRIVLERELAEIYFADEDKGFNIPYLIASIMVYVLFFGFLFLIFRKAKLAKKAKANQ
ncbi:alpha-amylase family glycosyl hydrolase [Sporosarcina soli]|uniref:Alpha-amylase family glycosyl hydrolase n=1 Tax=Sporosarcina soli TaxID=334736 RepID=A0ABW0TJV8_9BACL